MAGKPKENQRFEILGYRFLFGFCQKGRSRFIFFWFPSTPPLQGGTPFLRPPCYIKRNGHSKPPLKGGAPFLHQTPAAEAASLHRSLGLCHFGVPQPAAAHSALPCGGAEDPQTQALELATGVAGSGALLRGIGRANHESRDHVMHWLGVCVWRRACCLFWDGASSFLLLAKPYAYSCLHCNSTWTP